MQKGILLKTNHKLIVLDRDGVINEDSDDYIKSADEWMPISGSLEAIAKLKKNGWIVAVASNQSGISRGLFDLPTLSKIHHKILSALAKLNTKLDWLSFAPYQDDDNSNCRKPLPGMLFSICQRFNISYQDIIFIGDSKADLELAKRYNIKFYLVRTGKGENTLAKNLQLSDNIKVFDNLEQCVDFLI